MMTLHPSTYQLTMTFGKHRDTSFGIIAETDKSYLVWLADAEAMPDRIRTIAKKTLAGESIEEFLPAPTQPFPLKITEPDAPRIASLFVARKPNRIGIKYPYNGGNQRDVEFKEGMKAAVEGLKWEGEPDWYWSIPPVAIPSLIKYFGGTKNVHAEDAVKQMYRDELARRSELTEISQKKTTDFTVNTLLPLRPYQNVAVEFVVRAGGRAMIADAMGVGKTVSAIGYATHVNAKTLVICPKSVKPNWVREIKRFVGKESCIWEGNGYIGDLNAPYHIINYDIVDRHVAQLNTLGFILLVCDEATHLKNNRTKRSKAIMGYWPERGTYPGLKIKDLILLTGTPILNRPIEAYTLLNFISKERFGNKRFFTQQYGEVGERPRNLDQLHLRTKDVFIRRKKSEVLTELPEKLRSDLLVELSPEDMKKYDKLMNDMFGQWSAAGRPSAAQMPTIQKFLLQFKIERAKELIDEILAEGRSVLVFSTYQWVAEHIKQHYGPVAGLITGKTSGTARQKIVDQLSEGYLKVGAFTTNATGMGINGLQNSIDTAIFLDRWWVPAIHEQAEDRLHRSGQTMKVMIYYLTCVNTIDEVMGEVLSEKQQIIDQAVDGEMTEMTRSKSVFAEVVNRLKWKKVGITIGEEFDDLPTLEVEEGTE